MREWDVVTTVIITSEDGFVARSGRMGNLVGIKRLLNVTVFLGNWKSSVLRLSEDDSIITSALAVGSNMEEVHNLRMNDRELRLNQWLVVTTMIVVNEKNHVFHLHILGESGVNKEDWRLEDLVVGVYRLHIVATLEESMNLRLMSEDGVLDSSLSSADSFWNKRITFKVWIIIGRSLITLASWISEVRSLTFEIGILRVVRVTANKSVLLITGTELHKLSESLGGDAHSDSSDGSDYCLLHSLEFQKF